MTGKFEASQAVKSESGRCIPVRGDEIDTDRIIPARFMKVVTFDGLGQYAFQDERFDEKDNKKEHPFNNPAFAGASILLVNKNFGCGSSREHAPQALHRWGIKAVIGESFAEIFAGNCNAMGIPAVTLPTEEMEKLMSEAEQKPEEVLELELEKKSVFFAGKNYTIEMGESARTALLTGTWDSTATLLTNHNAIEQKFQELPYL